MYQHILVAIDDSETSRTALAEALHIARSSQARLHIVHVADETLMGMHHRTFSTTLNLDHALQAITEAGQKLLDAARAGVTGIDCSTTLLVARNRRVSEVLLEYAEAEKVDLIVLGRHGQRGLAKLIIGSVAEQVAKMANTSVLLVRKSG